MASKNPPRETPSVCPYCDETGIYRLADHLPCDAVPSTEEVLNA